MDRATAARIQEWDARPLTGGYRGLRELADGNFSGAVTTGTAWLFMLNGRVVGVVDGTMSAFEAAEATAYQAPDPALPLLFAMQERGGETQAKYYTDDNPLPEVHETLAGAGFTGYIELSEHVLSGDYYVVYYGGKSMSVAFVGNAQRLVTGDEAFAQAADEVGIYEVRNVELDVRTVPEPADEPAADAAEPPEEPGPAAEEPEPAPPEPSTPEPAEPPAEEAPTGDAPATGTEADPAPADQPAADGPGQDAVEPSPPAEAGEAEAATEGDPFTQEAAWREARTIPALDPEETEPSERATAENGGGTVGDQPSPPSAEASAQEPAPAPAEGEDIDDLRAAVESQSATIEELQARLEATQGDSEALREERERLEARLESARAAEAGAGDAGGRVLSPGEALEQTDLFVRYGTKGGGTLEKAHDGVIDREEVVNNLRVEHHTRFDADEVVVKGRPFLEFLPETVEFRFVDWLVTQLLFEIQDTGSQRGLRDLFDAIPLVDRVEFHGEVELRDEDAEEAVQVPFDVVCRSRMGQPLVVANLNDARDPATGEMMTGLIEGASAVAEQHETLGGAIMVTSSFFQPDALETAAAATGGGLLAREKRWSYVKLGRKQGFHLCLVEARGENFHVAVPEL